MEAAAQDPVRGANPGLPDIVHGALAAGAYISLVGQAQQTIIERERQRLT
jgi:hypothetical protein